MTPESCEELCMCLGRILTSPNVADSNGEAANLVDVVDNAADGLHRIADALEQIAGELASRSATATSPL